MIEQTHDETLSTPVHLSSTTVHDDAKFKSELRLLRRKYNRFEQKEKRIQVKLRRNYV